MKGVVIFATIVGVAVCPRPQLGRPQLGSLRKNCLKPCTRELDPHCTSDGQRFANKCLFEIAKCLDRSLEIVECPEVESDNKSNGNICPKGCEVWFDGCNDCLCSEDNGLACTRMACENYAEARCAVFTEKKVSMDVSTCPLGCSRYFDGCNMCGCEGGHLTTCTYMSCDELEDPACVEWDGNQLKLDGDNAELDGDNIEINGDNVEIDGDEMKLDDSCPAGCRLYFNGCNTCTCEGGHLAACTYMECDELEEPVCKEWEGEVSVLDVQPVDNTCPLDCSQFFDGCNTCGCVDGLKTICTLMACSELEPARCLG